jgi:hypothetical protein
MGSLFWQKTMEKLNAFLQYSAELRNGVVL